jgi:hypothetical protein
MNSLRILFVRMLWACLKVSGIVLLPFLHASHKKCFPPLIFCASGRSMRVFKVTFQYLSCKSSRSILVALTSSSSGLISSCLLKVRGSNSNTKLFFHQNVRESPSSCRLYGRDDTNRLTKLLKFG